MNASTDDIGRRSFELVLTALFTAIIVLMAYVPFLGYIPLVGINCTIIHIPVILGALFLGPKKGGFLGFIFGLTSFLNNTLRPATASAFVFSPVIAFGQFGAAGALKSTLICFLPRILVGVVPFFVYLLVRKFAKKGVALAIAGFSGAFTNTLLVMGGIFILYRDAYAIALGKPAETLINVIMGIVALNGSMESVLAAFLVTVIGLALAKATHTVMKAESAAEGK
ncbi:MAG: ECF transporter S component [Lachnospiraceae bacterium]|nr:ECF transporter S component [Lachnospiraceae bacterium]